MVNKTILMNGFNKTKAAVFSCRLCFLRAFTSISFIFSFNYNDKVAQLSVTDVVTMVMFQVVMDNCVEESDHRKDDPEYSVCKYETYVYNEKCSRVSVLYTGHIKEPGLSCVVGAAVSCTMGQ